MSEWFESYIAEEEGGGHIPSEIRMMSDIEEPRLHKGMLTLLARVYEYKLRSEDLLELTNGDTVLALATVIGVLEAVWGGGGPAAGPPAPPRARSKKN
jgi:hypothetical protein